MVPERNPMHQWKMDDKGAVTLEVENKGVFNTIAQKIFKRPRVSYIHLDRLGSFVWPLIDGNNDVNAIALLVDEHFGEAAKPLYPRIVKFFQVLESYGFVRLTKV